MKQPLLCWPESDLDLDRHPGRRVKAQDFVGAVVAWHRRDSAVLVRDVEGLLLSAKGVGLLAAHVESLRPGRARRDRPALDLDRLVARPGKPTTADGVGAEGQFRIAPGLSSIGGAVEFHQPQNPPVSSPQNSGLLQLNEIPTCHMSWL